MLQNIRVILQLRRAFRRGVGPLWFSMVGLHTKLTISLHLCCMLGGSVWTWMNASLRTKLILAPLGPNRLFFVRTSHYLRAQPNIEDAVCKTTPGQKSPSVRVPPSFFFLLIPSIAFFDVSIKLSVISLHGYSMILFSRHASVLSFSKFVLPYFQQE